MKNFKKILAIVLSLAMILSISGISFADEPEGETLPDVVLNGGEEGGSSMIKVLPCAAKKGVKNDDYKYQGYVSFLDMVPESNIEDGNYRYLVMTYTGDITKLRFEFCHAAGTDDEELESIKHWFDKENVTDENGEVVSESDVYFVSADGEPFTLVGEDVTLVIDLLESDVNLGYFNSGLHMHCSEMLTYGNGDGIVISDAYLTNTLPVVEEPTEPETEAPTEPETEAPTEAPTEPETEAPTEAPTEPETEAPTEAPTEPETEAPTEAPTEPETEAPTDDAYPDIILDGGEDGGSTMIKVLKPAASKGQITDDYKHQGFVSFLDMVPAEKIEDGNYRYLVMTYTGDITKLRFEFVHAAGTDDEDLEGVAHWFDKANVTDEAGELISGSDTYFVSADGNDFVLSGEDVTIVVDLLASDVDLEYYNSGLHMHCSEMLTYGEGKGIDIKRAFLTKTLPNVEELPEVTEPETKPVEPTKPAETVAPTEPADKDEIQAIVLDGGEEGKSSMMKKFANDKKTVIDADGNVIEAGYKYLGYASFLDLANENFKYLALTYTGDVTNLRIQFVHGAGGDDEELDPIVRWFDPSQENHLVAVDRDGKEIELPLVGKETTVFIDLEKSGIDLGWYNSGLHLHVNDIAEIEFKYAALLTGLPSEGEELPTDSVVGDGTNKPAATTAASNSASKPGSKPSTGDAMPVKAVAVVCLLSLIALCGTLVVRRKQS